MQLATNSTLVRRRVRLAGALHLAALVVFAIGLFVSFQPQYGLYSYIAIFIGLFFYQLAQVNLRRWGPRHRLDQVLARQLRGLDHRYWLVAFAAPELPDYLVVSPAGVHVLVTRTLRGIVSCRGDRWSVTAPGPRLLQLFRPPLGNPSHDARTGVTAVRRYLEQRAPASADVPVEAVVVFTHPEARLRIDGCSFPVVSVKDLRQHLRRARSTLNQARLASLRQALIPFEER